VVLCSRSSRADSGRTDTAKISLINSKASSTLVLTLLLNVSSVAAQESPITQNLDEEFLNYLADMSIEDGKIIDQLDMLELDSEVIETSYHEQSKKAQEINVKFKNEDFGSDEKEEQ